MSPDDLIAAIEAEEVPSSVLDQHMILTLLGPERLNWRFLLEDAPWPLRGFSYANVTGVIDAARALFYRAFPGWSYRIAECSVSDDAWVIPDFNHPEHGAALQKFFPLECHQDPLKWFGSDIDLRPSGRPAAAFCISMLTAHKRVLAWQADLDGKKETIQ